MNLQIIEENIKELEMADTTFDTVQELALLYIIKNNLKSPVQTTVEREYTEILPAYKKYVEAKRQFQLKQTDETNMIKYMELLCSEISDFLIALYSGTSTYKERKLLEQIFPVYIEKTQS